MIKKFIHIFMKIVAISSGILVALPVAWLFISSFRPSVDIEKGPYELPKRLTLQNYDQLLGIPGFVESLLNSFLIAILTTVVISSIALPTSYVFSRYSFQGKRALKTFSLVGAYLFAPAILAFPYFKILSSLGLVNSIAGIAIAHICFCLPFSLSIGDLIFRSVPRQIEEVAMIDNVHSMKRITQIVIPAALPQVFALVLLVFAISWKEFFFAFILSSDYTSRTLPVLLANQYGGESLNWNILCALSSVMIAPSLVVLLFGRKLRISSLLTPGTRG